MLKLARERDALVAALRLAEKHVEARSSESGCLAYERDLAAVRDALDLVGARAASQLFGDDRGR
jgi:hypothetical protein